jgi:hypothetical protein
MEERLQDHRQPKFCRCRWRIVLLGFRLRGHSGLLLHRLRDARPSEIYPVIDHLSDCCDFDLSHHRHSCLLLLWIIRSFSCIRICRTDNEADLLWLGPSWLDCLDDTLHSCKQRWQSTSVLPLADCYVALRKVHLCPSAPRHPPSQRKHRNALDNMARLHLRHCNHLLPRRQRNSSL